MLLHAKAAHTEGGGQWLYVQVEAGDEQCPLGACFETGTLYQ